MGQPLTRNVTDAALPMAVFSKPDARDYTALPYQEIDWIGSLRDDVKGEKLGLMLETGVGLKPQPAVRQAIAEAGKALARAGAIVEPVAPPSLPAECLTDWIFFGLPDRGAPDPRRVVSDTGLLYL